MSHAIPVDRTFLAFLFAADQDLAEQARSAGCLFCGGVLHSANYWRRPRGGPQARGLRFSFCCAEEGCRKRRTPESVRFLARRVYLGAVVVLLSALRQGLTPRRVEQLREQVGVSERTLARWRRWWLEEFAESSFWKCVRGWFAEPVERRRLPASLLERFKGDERSRLEAGLRFLRPITGGQGLAGHLSCGTEEIRRS